MRVSIERTINTAVTPSQRVLEIASMFGLGVDEHRTATIIKPTTLDLPIPGPGIVFITGPSGSGKSTMLRLIGRACRDRGVRVIDIDCLPPLPGRPLVDALDGSLEQVTSLLAAAGLADAFTMLRTPRELSDGQRYRLKLAQAMAAATGSGGSGGAASPCVILADEFGATLDRLTAAIIASNMRRWVRQSHCTFICATTHDDLLESLQPDLLVHKGLGDELETACATDRDVASRSSGAASQRAAVHSLRLEPGSASDYQRLAAFHYKSSRPGAVTGAFRFVHEAPTVVGRYLHRRSERSVVAVLLRTLPHLACALRDEATGGRYRRCTQRESAAMLNREVRTIARVVVHPQWRGLGLAVKLVKHALEHPEPHTQYTEALAAMGRVHPFFERAGMMRYDRPPHAQHARLADALQRVGLEPVMLASPRLVRSSLEGSPEKWALLLRELRRWHRSGARRSRVPKHAGEADVNTLLAAARDQLLTLPVYYLYRHDNLPRTCETRNAAHADACA